jgi:hypothetical protein
MIDFTDHVYNPLSQISILTLSIIESGDTYSLAFQPAFC